MALPTIGTRRMPDRLNRRIDGQMHVSAEIREQIERHLSPSTPCRFHRHSQNQQNGYSSELTRCILICLMNIEGLTCIPPLIPLEINNPPQNIISQPLIFSMVLPHNGQSRHIRSFQSSILSYSMRKRSAWRRFGDGEHSRASVHFSRCQVKLKVPNAKLQTRSTLYVYNKTSKKKQEWYML